MIAGLRTRSGEVWGALGLYRETGQPLFDGQELAFVQAVGPYLAEGARRALLVGEATDPTVMGPHRPLSPGVQKLREGWEATVPRWDGRLAPRTFVLGVLAEGRARAYVLDSERPGPRLLQDELGGVPVALLAPPGAWPLAYDRRTAHGIVDLRLEGDRVIDERGSIWTGNGEAVDGPRTGTRLTFIPSHVSEWYSWSAYHAETDIAAG